MYMYNLPYTVILDIFVTQIPVKTNFRPCMYFENKLIDIHYMYMYMYICKID